jgi:hypothetical protein
MIQLVKLNAQIIIYCKTVQNKTTYVVTSFKLMKSICENVRLYTVTDVIFEDIKVLHTLHRL